jgi:hypothetical protein
MAHIGHFPGIHAQAVEPRKVPTGDSRKRKGAWRCTTCATIISRVQYYSQQSMCENCFSDRQQMIKGTQEVAHDQTFPNQRIIPDVSIQLGQRY